MVVVVTTVVVVVGIAVVVVVGMAVVVVGIVVVVGAGRVGAVVTGVVVVGTAVVVVGTAVVVVGMAVVAVGVAVQAAHIDIDIRQSNAIGGSFFVIIFPSSVLVQRGFRRLATRASLTNGPSRGTNYPGRTSMAAYPTDGPLVVVYSHEFLRCAKDRQPAWGWAVFLIC